MAKYGKGIQKEVADELHKYKHEGKWKSRKQAIAVGLSEAREKGYKVRLERAARLKSRWSLIGITSFLEEQHSLSRPG